MVDIRFQREGCFLTLEMTGHADAPGGLEAAARLSGPGRGAGPGSIPEPGGGKAVCAGCSAIACALVGFLKKRPGGADYSVKKGFLRLRCRADEISSAAFFMAAEGFKQISREYPGRVKTAVDI